MGTASGVPLEELAGRCSLRHAALVAAVAVPRRLNTVHVGAVVGPRPQHLWSAEDGVTSKSAESCPSWDRTRTLLIQSQACCQLHQGAVMPNAKIVSSSTSFHPPGSGDVSLREMFR